MSRAAQVTAAVTAIRMDPPAVAVHRAQAQATQEQRARAQRTAHLALMVTVKLLAREARATLRGSLLVRRDALPSGAAMAAADKALRLARAELAVLRARVALGTSKATRRDAYKGR